MLVVHPASCCDVCLDPYAISSEPANSPHAIACGHIFCLTCLRSLSPSACPLCRKLFQPDRIKKLHVANPPELDSAEQDAINARSNLLLQRVALVSGEDTPEADVVQVLTEVQEWLQSQPHDPNSNVPLRASVAALQRYKALQDQSVRAKVEYHRLRHQLRNSKQNADHDIKTSRAVEESLLSRIQQIESEHAKEVNLEDLHVELEALRNPKPRYHNTGNPLPPPPEPLPIDRFPTFDVFLGGAVPYPAPPPRENHTNTTHVNGDAHASAFNQAGSSHKQFIPAPQTSKAPPVSHPRQPEPPHVSSTHSRATEPPPKVNGATRRTHIVAGTVHSSRTLSRPPSPTWAARPIVEDRRSDDERELRRKERNGVQINISTTSADVANDVSTRLASAAAYVSGYGSGYELGYHLANGNGNERVFPLQENQSPEQITGRFGLMGTHSRAGVTVEDNATPVARERHPPRRSVANAIRPGRMSRSLSDIPLLYTPVDTGAARRVPLMQSVGQVLDLNVNGDGNGIGPSRSDGTATAASSRLNDSAAVGPLRSNDLQIRMPRPQAIISPPDPSADMDSPRSETTWGTVTTGRAGSMDHLGLVGLHNGGVRGQGSVAGESMIGRLSSDDDTTTDEDEDDIDVDEVTPVIPTAGAADVSILGLIIEDGADHSSRNGERTRYRTPYPTQTPHPTSVSRSRTQQHPSRAERSTHRRRHISQPRAYDQEGITHVSSLATYNNTNALSLHFDASLTVHDHPASAISAPYTHTHAGHAPEIIAPTPVVGGPNIVHLWANRS
ncbi:hypothetical protein K503DRAFT_865511 [Rhizopogon vinicolor AM-OR11-026]|uniref:RING-type domain-containing protein n=1 Tax=Rhizopogon vinicolor AM-OR11-026 TaxID=1314800 RepID=A0A1B7N381_9AGAM|nr:hypothetical protein K503DRAFT_865511 [Rhizopogon vinicolor AM-OR11-026]